MPKERNMLPRNADGTPEASIESIHVQYELLQARISLHGNRLWQLPFTYVGFSSVAIPISLDKDMILPNGMFLIFLGIIGLIVNYCMYGAWKNYTRTGNNMNELERALKIGEFTHYGHRHSLPYFALCGFVTAMIFIAGLHLQISG